MRLLFDAGSLLNLGNGQVLDLLISTNEYDGFAGQIVFGECRSIRPRLLQLVAGARLTLLPDLALSASEFAAHLDRHNLGPGETECLLHAQENLFVISCDDRRARRVLAEQLGQGRVTGTIGLLMRAVHGGLLSFEQAFASYLMMRAGGGFLPLYSEQEFRALLP